MDGKSDKREVRAEDLADTILWKLGLRHEYDGKYDDIWQRLKTSGGKVQFSRISGFLSDLLKAAIAHRLQLVSSTTPGERTDLETLWRVLKGWVVADEKRRLPLVKHLLLQALRSKPATPAATPAVATPPPLAPKQVNARTNPPPPPAPPTKAAPWPAPAVPVATALPTEAVTALPAEEEDIPTVEPFDDAPAPADSQSRPPAVGSGWVYRPVPDDEPDRHPDNDKASLDPGDGYRLIGARARGKKHKHEATNCDDWFEWQQSGPWTIIAVADGAGSRRLSRLGAKISCRRAVSFLAAVLSGAELARDWPAGSVPLAKDPDGKDYLTPGIVFARNCLHEAFVEAYKAVERHAESIRDSEPHKRLLGRAVAVNDLSATLLMALHRTLKIGGVPQSLVMSCQIGDGAIAIVDRQAYVRLLGGAESSDFSGELELLTSRGQLEPANLQRRTSVQMAPLRALFVMTDGVADDYFPTYPGLARLYADLALNGVLLSAATEAETSKTDSLPPNIDNEVLVATAEGNLPVRLRSAALFAAALGCWPADLAASPDLLRAGARDTPLGKLPTAEDRLLQWLDAYQVRGSFDDRTLVVLHRQRDEPIAEPALDRRLPVYLVLDCSGSMWGEPIEALRQGMKALLADLRGDPQALETAYLSVITFNHTAQQIVPLTDLTSFQEPTLVAKGTTAFGAALRLLKECIQREVRPSTPSQKGDWKPVIFISLDGRPTDDWEVIADEIKTQRIGHIVACAAGPAVDMNVLKRVTDNVVELSNLQPDQLKAFFKWMSSSIQTNSQKLGTEADNGSANLPPPPDYSNIVIVP